MLNSNEIESDLQMKINYHGLIAVLLLMMPFEQKAGQAVLHYDPSGSSQWFPYYIVNDDNPGVLGELIPAILQQANIKGVQTIFPPKRTIEALNNGDIDFDIISPSWFPNKDVGAQFVLSKSLFVVKEHYVHLGSTQFNSADVKKESIGTVRGYYYHNDGKFSRRDFISEKKLIIALHKGRINYAIIGDLPALYWSKTLGVKIALGPIHSSGLLHIRLRKDKIALLPMINKAIDALMVSGEIQQKIYKYTKLKKIR